MINSKLFNIIKSQYSLPLNSLHGLKHWERVEAIGKHLITSTDADLEVVILFAYLHDSQRIDEDFDLKHGERATLFIEELFKEKILKISPDQLKSLVSACLLHSDGNAKPNNNTIATCWDADRLDLWRFGVIPEPIFLYSKLAKSVSTQELDLWTTGIG